MNRIHVLALVGLMAAGSVANAQHGHGGGGHGGGGHGGGPYYGGRLYYPNGYYRGGHYHPLIGIGVGIYGYGYPYYYPPIVVAPSYPYPPAPVFAQAQPQVAPVPNAPVPNAPPASYPSPGDMPPPKNAQIRVIVPDAQAKVWFDGNPTSSTGTERNYHTPDLTTGASSTYRIRATWVVNGREVTQEQAVPVQVGRMSIADFTRPVTEGVAPPPPLK
jgi:uncharacterized protein (TIGR03000 family)